MDEPNLDRRDLDGEFATALEAPGLETVKALATALVDSILADLPDPSVIDKACLLRRCAGVIVLAEQEGMGKVRGTSEARQEVIELQRRTIKDLDEIGGILQGVVRTQESIIIAQAEAMDAAIAGAGLRELRLPH